MGLIARPGVGFTWLISASALVFSGCIQPNSRGLVSSVIHSSMQLEPSPLPSTVPLPSITASPIPALLPPSTVTYGSNPAVYKIAAVITPNAPATTGGVPTSFSIAPALPAGITLNPTTGIISGTPTAIRASANYIVKAMNAAGSAQVTLAIAISDNVVAPTNLAYAGSPASFTRTVAVTPLAPASQGGAPTAYAVATTLPAGLTLNATTGVISGTPTAVQAAINYQITATNSAGSTSATVSIAVKELAPATVTYAVNPAKYVKGTQIVANAPQFTGGTPTSYKISPALPAGLAFNTATGAISGTPTEVLVMTPFQITGTNTGGSAVVTLAITVNDIAPATLTYSAPRIVYTKGTAIGANLALSTGGTITTFTVAPALPAGLSLNATSGTINGTPTSALLPILFKVTGSNSGGSIIAQITLGVADLNDPNANYNYIQTSILGPKCNGCHGVGSGFGNLTTYAGVKVYSVPGSPLTSPFYTRTAPGAANPMPPNGSLPAVESFAILNWIALGAPAPVAPSPTPSPVAAEPTGGTLMEASDSRLRLGNRLFVSSTLNEIFGSAATAPIEKLIMAQTSVDVLGAPCNAYSNFGRIDYANLSIGSDCASIGSAQVASIPVATTARGALMTRTCDLILAQDSAVLNAASIVLGTSMTASTLPAMTSESVAKVYDLFYFGRPLGTQIATDLMAIANAGENSMESWRYSLITLCYAPDWQIP